MKKSLNIITAVSTLIIFLVSGCTNANDSISKAHAKTLYESLKGCLKRCDESFSQEMKTYQECMKPHIKQLLRQLGTCRNLPPEAREKCEKEAEKNYDAGILRCDELLNKAQADIITCRESCMKKFPSEMGFE